jgi:hypothetical protein
MWNPGDMKATQELKAHQSKGIKQILKAFKAGGVPQVLQRLPGKQRALSSKAFKSQACWHIPINPVT